jgi:hypothetical protein
MSNFVVVIRDGLVSNVFVGNESEWSESHRSSFYGATFAFCSVAPAVGDKYNEETGEFEKISVQVQDEEVLPE